MRLPIGLSYGIEDRFWITGEAAWGFDVLNGPVDVLGSDTWTFGLAGSYRF